MSESGRKGWFVGSDRTNQSHKTRNGWYSGINGGMDFLHHRYIDSIYVYINNSFYGSLATAFANF